MTPKKIVKTWFDNIDSKNFEGIRTLMASNHKFHNPMTPAPIGPEEHIGMMQMMTSAFAGEHHIDELAEENGILKLNRCIAILELSGPEKAFEALNTIKDRKQLESYYLFHAVNGELSLQTGNPEKAVHCFQKAYDLTHSEQEKRFLKKRISQITEKKD